MFKSVFEQEGWKVALYEELEKFAKKKGQTEEDFNKIFSQSLKTELSAQATIS